MKSIHRLACSLLVALSAITCTRAAEGEKPSIEILQAPNLAPGPDRTAPISGKVSGVKPNGARVIIYALGDRYYVQPWTAASVTEIAKDLTFKNTTHGGDQYLALLVKPSFKAPATLSAPPEVGGDVLAITTKAPRKE